MSHVASALQPIADLATLDSILGAESRVGAGRVLRIMEQLARELEQAHRLGVVPVGFTLESVLLEYPGTPFERVRIPYWSEPGKARGCTRAHLREVGAWLRALLAEKRFYLDPAASLRALGPAPTALTSRADLEVLRALLRGLRAIAKRCEGGLDAVAYSSPAALARDLARLATLTGRVAARLRQARADLLAHAPRPALRVAQRQLPKVILNLYPHTSPLAMHTHRNSASHSAGSNGGKLPVPATQDLGGSREPIPHPRALARQP
jgi:hypothetical protein